MKTKGRKVQQEQHEQHKQHKQKEQTNHKIHQDPVPKRIRTLKAYMEAMKDENKSVKDYPSISYFAIYARKDGQAVRKYCDLTGLPAKYCCPKTGILYCSSSLYPAIKALSVEQVQYLLKMRCANTVLK